MATSDVQRSIPQPRSFNPNEHLTQIKTREGARDYLPVQWRIVWFREVYPHGTITTEMMHLDIDRDVEAETFGWNSEARRSERMTKHAKGFVVFHAVVDDGGGGRAEGTKSENAASFPDYIEKAETGAIGRALAALGFGTQFAGELSEGEKAEQSVQQTAKTSSAPAPSQQTAKTTSVPMASAETMKELKVYAARFKEPLAAMIPASVAAEKLAAYRKRAAQEQQRLQAS